MPVELSDDLVYLAKVGFAKDLLAEVFPCDADCEFSERPMHGCECNPCVKGRAL